MDAVHTTTKAIDYNRYFTLALFAILVVGVMLYTGCDATTPSLVAPAQEVTRGEFEAEAVEVEVDFAGRTALLQAEVTALNAEIAGYNTLVDAGRADLDRQDALMTEIIAVIGQTAEDAASGVLNPIALIPFAVGLMGAALGLGTSLDNRRKDKVITALKNGGKA